MTQNIDLQQLQQKYQQGVGVSELANHFNCGENTIRRRLRRLGVSTSTERLAIKSKEWFIEKYVHQKWSANKIAKELGCSKRPILDRLQKYGVIRNSSQAAKIKMADPKEREKISKARKGKFCGENSARWQGGKTKISILIRQMIEYKNWREEIFQRDNFTCRFCKKTNCVLNADHIKPFSIILKENKINSIIKARNCEELWNIENGRTLCVSCHRKTDTFAGRCQA